MKIRRWLAFVIAIIVPQAAGWIGSAFTIPSIPTWYAGLAKPALNPPAWVFGPVWTTLYLLMGIAAYAVWRKGQQGGERALLARRGLSIFLLQLILNAGWSVIFFGLHMPWLGFGCLVLLWLAIAWNIWAFRKVSTGAAWLLAPYLAWVTFAGYLNLALALLNP